MSTTDHRLFLKLFLPAEAVVKAYLLSATGDMRATDDLLQEVSSVLWEKFDRYDGDRPFRPWALGVARLEVLKWRQGLARNREVLSSEAVEALMDTAAEHAGEMDDRLGHLRDCVKAVSGTTRRMLQLRYWKVLAVGQIAEQLGKTAAAIEMALVRARRGLRKCVEKKLARARGGGS